MLYMLFKITDLSYSFISFAGGLGLDADISQLTNSLYSTEFVGCIANLQLRGDLRPNLTEAEGYNVHVCDDGSR